MPRRVFLLTRGRRRVLEQLLRHGVSGVTDAFALTLLRTGAPALGPGGSGEGGELAHHPLIAQVECHIYQTQLCLVRIAVIPREVSAQASLELLDACIQQRIYRVIRHVELRELPVGSSDSPRCLPRHGLEVLADLAICGL